MAGLFEAWEEEVASIVGEGGEATATSNEAIRVTSPIGMNEFKIFAHGPSFDVDAYLAVTNLEFDNVWRRGDQRRYSCVKSEHDTSGVEIILGDGYSIPFSKQKQIAIEFLIRRRDDLRALAEFDGVQTFILGLQYNVSLKSNTIGFTVSSSARLMWHALDVGLRPTYYVVLDRIGVER